MRNQTNRKGDSHTSHSGRNRQNNDHLYRDFRFDNQDHSQTSGSNNYHEDITPKEQANFMNSMLSYNDLDMTMWNTKQQQPLQGQHNLASLTPITHTTLTPDSDFSMISNLNDVQYFLNTTNPAPLITRPQDKLYLENSLTGTIGHDQENFHGSSPAKSDMKSHGSAASDPGSRCRCFTDVLQAIETSRSLSPQSNVGSVMNHNRQAMARVCSLLRCTEEHDTMVGLLVLVLISKILNLCEAIYNAQQETETGEDTPNSMGTATASSTSLSDLQNNILHATRPVSPSSSPSSGLSLNSHADYRNGSSTPTTRSTFGSYEFEQDDEHQLKTQMMLIRLVKLKSLLNRFNEAQWTGGKSMMEVSSTMRGVLIEKVEAVMDCMQMSVKL